MTAAISTPKSNPYIVGKLFDMLILTGSVSLMMFPFIPFFDQPSNVPYLWVTSTLFNNPHYSATYERVYSSWKETKAYTWGAIVAPLILLVLLFCSCNSPLATWYCTAYLITSGFHYSGQTYGLTLISAGKSGIKLQDRDKNIIRAVIKNGNIVYKAAGLEGWLLT